MVPNRKTQIVEETAQLGKKWDLVLVLGMTYLALAIIALAVPDTIGPQMHNALTLLFFASGGLRLIEVFSLRKNFGLERNLFPAILSLVAGIMLFRLQSMQAGGLGLVLSFYFLATATAQFVSFTDLMAVSPWRWALASAGTSLVIGVDTLFNFPLLVGFVPSDLVGIYLFVNGISMIGFSQSLKNFSAEFYSTKETLRGDSGRKEDYQREPQALRKRDNSATVSHDGH